MDKLYLGGNNLSRAYDVIQGYSGVNKKSNIGPVYVDFKKLFEKAKEIFSITGDVKEM